jgi:iron uptake system EfeUOB component EfeO/EfeM
MIRRRLAIPLALVSLLAGCGGGATDRHAAARPDLPAIAPGAVTETAPSLRIAGTDRSAQDVATAAAAAPDAAGVRSELAPVPRAAFRPPIARWRAGSRREAAAFAAAVARLRADVAAGAVAAARRDWLVADVRLARIGAAYGALGPLGVALAGRPGRLTGGVSSPRFTGMHAVERALWTGRDRARLPALSAGLVRDGARLRRRIAAMAVSPLDYTLRAHEILEDAQRDDLSGEAAPWSGAGLRVTAGAYAATRRVIGTLRPLLEGRGDALEPVESGLRSFGAELAAVRRGHGGELPSLRTLGRRERERLDGRLGQLLEALAAIPPSLETRLPSAIPPLP